MRELDVIFTHPGTVETEDLAVGEKHKVGHAAPFGQRVVVHVGSTDVGGEFDAGR